MEPREFNTFGFVNSETSDGKVGVVSASPPMKFTMTAFRFVPVYQKTVVIQSTIKIAIPRTFNRICQCLTLDNSNLGYPR
ncbi:hypothetical protein C5167_036509 [Papaver somniferum]|uniref:Uncharacterized protein n=1 Tax=Papaver somniferum TaxID=3469 RepID=A0A4Y7I492_PAPSO|nr:hypothetical protein C5167_036509 [Papaver somniferum]